MEQDGASGLLPLLPSVPVLVPVTNPEQTEEQDSCSLTELVPVHSKQHTSATDRILAAEEELVDDPNPIDEDTSEMLEDTISPSNDTGSKTVAPGSQKFESLGGLVGSNDIDAIAPDLSAETMSETASETYSEANSDAQSEKSQQSTTSYHLPPHVLGRTVENPSADISPGRRVQKPRLGVKVPYRNLTSQIVTQNEIAQEIFERTAKKHPSPPVIPKTEIFTRKLTQRLCSSITSSGTKPKAPIVPDSIGGALKALLPNKQSPAIADGMRLSPGFTYNEKDKALDDAELLSILEGDGDPLWLPEKLLRKPENPAPGTAPVAAGQSPVPAPTPSPAPPQLSPPKLDPAVEKELALKQLMELPIAFPSKKIEKKDKPEKRPRKGAKARKDAEEVAPELSSNVPNPELASGLSNGGSAENAPPAPPVTPGSTLPSTPVAPIPPPDNITPSDNSIQVEQAPPSVQITANSGKKPSSNRKRKMTPEVEAVLKKTKLSKKEPVPNAIPSAKTKGSKAVPNPSTPADSGKAVDSGKTPETGKKKTASNRKTPQPKTDVEVVTNGNTDNNNKKKVVKRVSKGKTEDETPKKTASKPPQAKSKTPKDDKKSPPRSQALAPAVKQKSGEINNEDATEVAKDQPMEVDEAVPSLNPVEEHADVQPQQKKPTRINRELEHLLGDEGAVNMLYSVEGHKRKGSKDLALKTRLVKTAVMRLSTTSQGHMPVSLRARRSMNVAEPPKLVKMSGNRKQRNHSSESFDAMRSPPYLTPVEGASQMFSPRQKLTADDSRIIRRHSSSSSFSSPSVSPRRVSVEESNMQQASTSQRSPSSPRKKGVPIFIRDKAKALTYDGKKKPKILNPALDPAFIKKKLLELQNKKYNLLPNPAAILDAQAKSSVEVNGRMSTATAKKLAKLHKAQLLAERKAALELAKAQKAAEQLLQVQREVEEQNKEDALPISPTAIKQEGKKSSVQLSPDAASEACECPFGVCLASCATCVTGPLFCVSPTGYSNLLKSLQPKGKGGSVEERQRATARHCAGTYNYKEITVRRYDNIFHVILAPVSTKMSSALNIQVLRELRDALQQVRKDDQCKVVLLTSTGSIFCQGIDLSALVHNNNEKRKTAAFEMSLALKDFLKCVAHFPKPLIAGVQGSAVGLGVTMLPLFDMVFASDKATFHTPYAELGQVPEGGATLTLPHLLGHTATSELLLNSRKMTSNEALQCGLVTRILWPDRFMEELIPIIKKIAQQSAQSMEATKALLRHGLRTKFDAALESETHLLVTHWTSKECQTSYQNWMDNGEVCLQRTT
ncbi:uncharacterized protein LOC117651111 isoform X2 [Thrips palmi]|uniref:Uncharacterized protein LOC117651111 isoform X2 n=1 Tax=Thrips palmi TaxID=161013 RepID=A0A6P9A1N1_THRPL|nr:uncharacterized protein LOC117651111 isoform X2 [Thrips palmi]